VNRRVPRPWRSPRGRVRRFGSGLSWRLHAGEHRSAFVRSRL